MSSNHTSTGATTTETVRVRGEALVAEVRRLLHEGNVRRIVVQNHEGHTVMEVPLTAGVLVAVVAPVVAAVTALAGLANDWQVEVVRTAP